MIYVTFDANGQISGVTDSYEEAHKAPSCRDRNDWTSKEEVDTLAAKLTEVTGDLYLGLASGGCVRPQFDIFKAPKVGDEVSMGFNGDYYPCGKIVSISKTLRKIVTDNGTTFWRRGQGARWLNCGTFAMIPGVHNERNPSF